MSRRSRIVVMGASLLVLLYVALGGLLGRTAAESAYRPLTVFSEVLTHIRSDYVVEPDLSDVAVGALHGLLGQLDPYSSYLTPREYAELLEKKQNLPAGEVGLVLSKRFGFISVVTVFPDSPAARAELHTGDILESIEGFSTRTMSIEQAQILLAGEPGSSAKVSVVRQRAEPEALDLVRARPRPTRVLTARPEDDIGYLKVATLAPGKTAEIRSALERLQADGARKLILDLRDCATGAVEEAVGTARLFLASGLITYVEGQKFPRQQFTADPARVAWSGPVTVLVNTGTAGPAEILAAAVLDNQRGEVVGQRSHGVGSVQKLIPLENGSALILSVAKYYSPGGPAIQDNGVTPSVQVELPAEQALVPVPHAVPRAADPAFLRALEVLRSEPVAAPAAKAA